MLKARLRRYPTADDIESLCNQLQEKISNYDLLRIYFYDAPPATGKLTNPIDGSSLDLSQTDQYSHGESLLDKLEMKPHFAVRRGEAIAHGWKLGLKAVRSLKNRQRELQAKDVVPDIEQKGVDLRIGLDIARLALRGMVRAIIIVTGDSDLVPAFKFARREGVRIYLNYLGHSVRRDLKAHADVILDINLPKQYS